MTSGNFTFIETKIQGVYIIDVKTYGDMRGCFFEIYKKSDFDNVGFNYSFVQDNQSFSRKGVLRGLHFQIQHPQAKLVRVLSGEIFDVAVDLRKDSDTYGQWVGVTLSADNHRQIIIPRGFAHGFIVVSDCAEIAYKCDDFYYPEDESGIAWNDSEIAIEWPNVGEIILSEKDKNYSMLKDLKITYEL